MQKSLKTFIVCAITHLSLAQPTVHAQPAKGNDQHPDYEAVMAVIDQLFVAINTNDTALMRTLVVEEALNFSVRQDPDGNWEHRSYPQTYFLDPANYGPEKIMERYWDPTVLISGGIAVFWAPYDLYRDGNFSHCGTDAFDLIKVGGQWKVGNGSWTVERENCTLHPDGPPTE